MCSVSEGYCGMYDPRRFQLICGIIGICISISFAYETSFLLFHGAVF